MTEFVAWPKTPRLYRDVVITEKIDGTNACVVIESYPGEEDEAPPRGSRLVGVDDSLYLVSAQSRTRIITPDGDNFGFARWAWDNATTLVADLGEGRHYGEWYGQGITRRYGLDHKRFALFNAGRWRHAEFSTPNLEVVPVIYEGVFSDEAVEYSLGYLMDNGSPAANGFLRPEGICIFHTQSRQVYKVLLENDDVPKSAVNKKESDTVI